MLTETFYIYFSYYGFHELLYNYIYNSDLINA